MSGELRLLILEDRPADAELAMRELRHASIQFVAKRVATEADFLAQLRDSPPDFILADYSLPAYDGLSALAAAQKECPGIPFIFVSGSMGEETAIEALHHGATDYVLKQRLTRLGPAMERALREIEQRRHRAQAERNIHELNLLLRAIREISQLIVRERDPQRLLAEACNILIQTRGYSLAWVGLAEPGSKCVVPAAWAGDRADYLDDARITWDETPTGQGPTGTAMRTGKPWVCQDTATDPRFGPWRETALARGYASAAAVPMKQDTRIVGAVTVYSDRRDAFQEEELGLLKELAEDLAFALQSIEDEKERESAESALAENRRLLKALLDNIPDPAWLKDLQGRFLACNEPVAQLCGRKPEEILGKTVFDSIPSEAGRMTREDQEVVVKGKPIQVEMAITGASGQRRWFDTIKSPLFNERGEVIGTVGIARETTERRQTDEALRVSEDRFRSVWENSIDGMRLTDRAGRILAVNQAFCRLVKLPREKLIGQVFSVAYEENGPDEVEAYRRHFEAGTFEPRLIAHLRLWNSEELDVEISSSFVEPGHQSKALLSLFRDIGERKRAEVRVAALSHIGQQLSAATSARQAGEIIVAAADQLLGWGACSFALYSAAENAIHRVLSWDTVDGRRIESVPPDDHAPPLPLTRRVIEEGGQLILKEDPNEMLPDSVAFGNTTRPSASILFVPARAGVEVVAVLSIHSYTPRAYDQRGLETLQVLADHCAGALKRIRAQEALSTSEANYRSLVECSPDAIFLHQDEKFVYANLATLKLLGAENPQQLLGRSVFDIVPPRNRDLVRQRIRQAKGGEAAAALEQEILRLDGTALDVEATGIPFVYGGKPAVQTVMRDVTERKRSLEVLAQERHLLRTLIDNLPDYVFVKDAQSRFVLNNQAHLALLKAATQAEVVGKTDEDIFPPELAALYHADEQAVLRSGEPLVNREESTVDPAGKVRWLLTTKVPVRDEQGKITGLAGVSRDITERKQAELQVAAFSKLGQKLSASKTVQEAGELIIEVADQLLGWDACSFALYSSAEKLIHHVLSRDTVDGRRIEGQAAYDDSPPSPIAKRAIKEGGQLILKEDPDQMASGGVPFGNKARPSASILFVPARAGAEIVAVLSIHSYTPKAYDQRGLETVQMLADHCAGALKRIRAQAALSSSEANYRSLVEGSPDAIFLHRDEEFVYANPAALKLLGAEKPQQILALSVSDIVPPENLDLIRRRIRQAAEGAAAPPLEQKILRLDGTTLDIEATSIPFTYEGKPAVQTVMRDITGRKQLEQQLRQSQKMDAIGQLAGGVAHDFNNMLAVIRGNAELVLMDVDQHTPATNECLKQIMAASERAANLTRQLLVFSRKQVMQSQPLVLNKVIAELTKMLKRIIGEHIDLECRYADPLPFVRADAGMLEQVLLNLAVNARDAMPRGGHLLIATDTASFDTAYARNHPGSGAGEYVRLTVTDTGTGIAPEHLPRIFEPFFTTKEVGKGTGLGLATVYGIVRQHQGWIEVSSQPGAGATFKIFLPVIPSPAVAAAASKAETQVPGGAETILLVEDEYAVRAVTRRVLESQGYRIYEATTVREALEVWRSHAEEIELLLTDIVMPQGLTGRELAKQLRAQRPALKVIFMSGYSADVVGKDTDFFRRTKSFFLQKPCSARTILETVRRCLDEK